jgi:hypothetical protein
VSFEQGVALKQRANLKEEKKQRIWMAMLVYGSKSIGGRCKDMLYDVSDA